MPPSRPMCASPSPPSRWQGLERRRRPPPDPSGHDRGLRVPAPPVPPLDLAAGPVGRAIEWSRRCASPCPGLWASCPTGSPGGSVVPAPVEPVRDGQRGAGRPDRRASHVGDCCPPRACGPGRPMPVGLAARARERGAACPSGLACGRAVGGCRVGQRGGRARVVPVGEASPGWDGRPGCASGGGGCGRPSRVPPGGWLPVGQRPIGAAWCPSGSGLRSADAVAAWAVARRAVARGQGVTVEPGADAGGVVPRLAGGGGRGAARRAGRGAARQPGGGVLAGGPGRGRRVGMRRREAQGRCPALVVLDHDQRRDARRFEAVAWPRSRPSRPGSRSPAPGACAFATRGPSRYFGGDQALAEQVHDRVHDVLDGARLAGAGARRGGRRPLRRHARRPSATTPTLRVASPIAVVEPGTVAGLPGPAPRRRCSTAPSWPTCSSRLGLRTLGRGGRPARRRRGRPLRPRRPGRPPPGPWPRRAPARRPPTRRPTCVVSASSTRRPSGSTSPRSWPRPWPTSCRQPGRPGPGLHPGADRAETEHGEAIERLWRHEGALTAGAVADRVRWQLDGLAATGSAAAPRPPAASPCCALVPDEVVPARGRQLGFWGGETEADEPGRCGPWPGCRACSAPTPCWCPSGGAGAVRASSSRWCPRPRSTSPRPGPATRPDWVTAPWPGPHPGAGAGPGAPRAGARSTCVDEHGDGGRGRRPGPDQRAAGRRLGRRRSLAATLDGLGRSVAGRRALVGRRRPPPPGPVPARGRRHAPTWPCVEGGRWWVEATYD